LLQHIGKKQEAEKAKQRCIEKYRKQIEKDSDGTNQFLLAKAYLAFHDYSKAESSIKKALELEPDEGSYKMTLAKIYAKQNKFAEAQKLSDSVPMSNCSCTYENKAEILQASGQYDKSLSLLDKGIADDSKSVNCYYLRSIAYKHKGMNDKATADMKKAKELGYYSDPLLRLDI
jgi:tetratricopeptide (TPR) repeat protein